MRTRLSLAQVVGLGYDGASCTSPDLAMASSAILTVLDGSPVRYEIEDQSLTISRADRILLFRAEP